MVINVIKTIKAGSFQKEVPAEAPALANIGSTRKEGEGVHLWLERTPTLLSILAFITIAIGGLVEIVPTLSLKQSVPTITSVKPYTPLELEGRDLYIREGCNSCHSQMINHGKRGMIEPAEVILGLYICLKCHESGFRPPSL